MVKANEAFIRFTFITGISKFTHVGIFSALNHIVVNALPYVLFDANKTEHFYSALLLMYLQATDLMPSLNVWATKNI